MGIEIRTHLEKKPLADFPISLVKLNSLIPHEQIISEELASFIESAKRDKMVFHPMLVDKESYLILDGHHRHRGLLDMGYLNAPAIYINYHDDDLVSVGTWFPLIDKKLGQVIKLLSEINGDIKEVSGPDYNLLQNRGITAVIGNQENLFSITAEREEIFQIVRENWLDNILYYDNEEAIISDAGKNKTAIISWAYTKKEIIDSMKSGGVFLPKTTRHTLSYRFKKCNYPLSSLETI